MHCLSHSRQGHKDVADCGHTVRHLLASDSRLLAIGLVLPVGTQREDQTGLQFICRLIFLLPLDITIPFSRQSYRILFYERKFQSKSTFG